MQKTFTSFYNKEKGPNECEFLLVCVDVRFCSMIIMCKYSLSLNSKLQVNIY